MPSFYKISPEIPASKTERLQPKFLRKNTDNGTSGEMVAREVFKPFGQRRVQIRETDATSAGSVKVKYGRQSHTGLSKRFPHNE